MSEFRFRGKLGIGKSAASLGPDDSHLPADEPDDDLAGETELDESPAERGHAGDKLIDTEWAPPTIVVMCEATDCTHNYKGYCSGVDGNITIELEPDMGTSKRATECAHYDPTLTDADEDPNS